MIMYYHAATGQAVAPYRDKENYIAGEKINSQISDENPMKKMKDDHGVSLDYF